MDQNYQNMPPQPNNNMVLAIITTIFCCLPLGIFGIVKASQVNSLYRSGNYDAAKAAADEAKNWSLIGLAIGLVINSAFFLVNFFEYIAGTTM